MDFTNGDWKLWNDEIIAFLDCKEDRKPICKIYHNHHDCEAHANARLIERAPKLYHACMFAIAQLSEHGWVDSEIVEKLELATKGIE